MRVLVACEFSGIVRDVFRFRSRNGKTMGKPETMKFIVHPEYDGNWFTFNVEGNMIEEKTLCALKARLGPSYKLIGYYPNGYRKKTIWPEDLPQPKKLPEPMTTKKFFPSNNFGPWTDEKLALLKEMQARNETISAIAAAVGKSHNAVIGKLDRISKKEKMQGANHVS